MRAEVVDHVEVASLLHPATGVPECLLRDLGLLLTAQHELMALVGALDHMQDVPVIRRVQLDLVVV